MMDLNDEQYHRLQHAIAVTRESLAIAAELGDDLSAFQLKHALHSLHYISELEAEGHDDRRLLHAIDLARESLVIAVEMDDDITAFHLKTALRSLDYSRKLVSA